MKHQESPIIYKNMLKKTINLIFGLSKIIIIINNKNDYAAINKHSFKLL